MRHRETSLPPMGENMMRKEASQCLPGNNTTLRREASPKPLRLRRPLRYPIFILSHPESRSNSARKDIRSQTLLRARARRREPTQAYLELEPRAPSPARRRTGVHGAPRQHCPWVWWEGGCTQGV